METTEPLSTEALGEALTKLPHWNLVDRRLHGLFEFESFARAMAFMQDMAKVAEATQHHPEWRNDREQVEVWLTTHDLEGVTHKDVALAMEMEKQGQRQGHRSSEEKS